VGREEGEGTGKEKKEREKTTKADHLTVAATKDVSDERR
jgi:hypothetical protein